MERFDFHRTEYLLFFSERIGEINKSFPNLLGLPTSENGEEGDGGNDGEDTEGAGETDRTFVLLALIREFSEMTHDKWGDVFETDIYTFFNILAFSRKWNEYEKKQRQKWIARN